MKTMTDMTIEEQLRQTWKQERRFCHARGLCRCMIWLALLLFLGFLIDWGLLFKNRMPATVSPLLGVTGLITMLWVFWHDWLRRLRPYDATRIALEVEARHPRLMSSLVSYTQLESMGSGTEASPELLGAMRDFAVGESSRLKFSDIVDFSQLKKLVAYAVIVLVLVGGLSVRWSDHFGALVKRLAGIDTTYPINTRLVDISGDMIVPFGETTAIVAKAGGVIPGEAVLHVKPVDGEAEDWKELPMDKLANGVSFRRELQAPDRDMQYFVTMGDCRSEPFHISIVRSPKIVRAELQQHFPAYLKRPAEKTDQLSLEVPKGTRIQWRLHCDKPVGKLSVVYGDRHLDADVDESGRDISFSLTADRNFSYTFEWTEGASGKSFQFQDVEHSVRTTKDSKPQIAFSGKAPSGPATIGKKAAIAWNARDDYGLGKIWLVYTVTTPGQTEAPKEHRVLLHDPRGHLSSTDSHTWILAKGIPDLEPGRQISYHLETADLSPGEKSERIARSPVRQMTILGNEEYLNWYRRELSKRNETVKEVFSAEIGASKQIKELLVEQGGE